MDRAHERPIVHQDIRIEKVLVKSLGAREDCSDIDNKLSDYGMFEYHDPTQFNPLGFIVTTHCWPLKSLKRTGNLLRRMYSFIS
jgi:hypothetical protein